MLLSQEHVKERREQRKWVRPQIRKRNSKETYYSVINDLSLTDKDDFRKYLRMNTLTAIPILLSYLNKKLKLYVSTFSILYKYTLFVKKFFAAHA